MTDKQAQALTGSIAALFPNYPLSDETLAGYVRALAPVDARDAQEIFDAVLRECEWMPPAAKILQFAKTAAANRIASQAQSDYERAEKLGRLTGISQDKAAENRDRLKQITRDYLQQVNAAKATNRGMLPDDWERTESPDERIDRTRCPACKGNDPACKVCDGAGLVCPTCRGTHVLSKQLEYSQRPHYVGCLDCTDWASQMMHHWTDGNWPKFKRDYQRERATIHASRSGRLPDVYSRQSIGS